MTEQIPAGTELPHAETAREASDDRELDSEVVV